jgi:hypothetical protein
VEVAGTRSGSRIIPDKVLPVDLKAEDVMTHLQKLMDSLTP